MNLRAITAASVFALSFVIGCGGGGGGDDSTSGIVLEGTLIQGAGGSHARIATKHSEGEPLEEVEICALGSCSTTDATGHWGFLAEGNFAGGDVLFTVNGHEISSSPVVSIPAGTQVANVEFIHTDGVVSAHTLVFDGVEQVHSHDTEEEGHDHES